MSPKVICALAKYMKPDGSPECERTFYKSRPWQKCCCRKHQNRLTYLERKALLETAREMASKRAQMASNARTAHSRRVYCRRVIEPGFTRKALEVLGLRIMPQAEGGNGGD